MIDEYAPELLLVLLGGYSHDVALGVAKAIRLHQLSDQQFEQVGEELPPYVFILSGALKSGEGYGSLP